MSGIPTTMETGGKGDLGKGSCLQRAPSPTSSRSMRGMRLSGADA